MKKLAPVDVVIVGSGWSGMIMAKEIATRTPLSVLMLERGGAYRGLAAYGGEMDEVDTYIRKRWAPDPAVGLFTSRASREDRANPVRQYGGWFPSWGTGVGGSSDHWGATSPRFVESAFNIRSHLIELWGESKLPPGNMIQDYGVTWKEMEPYYCRAEAMMGTCGKAGNLNGKIIEGGNPFEGPRSCEFPNPPHTMMYAPLLFAKAAKELGYRPFPMPCSTLSRDYTHEGVSRLSCQYCGHCSLFGCMVGAKASPNFTLLPIVKTKKNFELRTHSNVRRIVHKGGKAVGVIYVDESGTELMQPAETVVLAAWCFNNARLLMLSGIGEQYDPVTAKGTLGKNCTYAVGVVTELFLDKPQNVFMGSGGLAMGIGEFSGDLGAEGAAKGAFRGGLIFCYTQGDPPVISSFGSIPDGSVRRNWGAQWKNEAMKWHDRYAVFLSTENHFPYRQNYLDLDPTYTDKWGDPLLRVTMNWTDAERDQAAFISEKEIGIAKAMGAIAINPRPNPSRTSGPPLMGHPHSHGGAIMGASPQNSVVNPYLQHWQMPNLWVVGGSALPQGEEHLTLTVAALAYRAADAFVERYVKRPGALA